MSSSKRRRGNAEDSERPAVVPVAVEDELEEEDAEPEELMCPITRVLFRDPALVVESGQTYERKAIRSHFRQARASAPRGRPRTVQAHDEPWHTVHSWEPALPVAFAVQGEAHLVVLFEKVGFEARNAVRRLSSTF